MQAIRKCSDLSTRKDLGVTTLVVFIWMCLSVSLNFYNKYVLARTGFNFPVFFTMWHMIASFIGCHILIKVFDASTIQRRHWTHYKWRILTLSTLFVTNIITNNTSLLYISLSINQIIKSSLPVVMVLLSMYFQGKKYSASEWACILLLVLGCGLSTYQNAEFHMLGFLFCLASTAAVGLWVLASDILLKPTIDEKGEEVKSGLDSVNLLYYSSLPSFCMLFVLYIVVEFKKSKDWIYQNASASFLYILIGSLLAFAFNIFHFALVKWTSALTSTVAGNFKVILIIVFSVMLLEKVPSAINVVGMIVSSVGFVGYSWIQYEKKNSAKAAQAAAQPGPEPKVTETTRLTVDTKPKY